MQTEKAKRKKARPDIYGNEQGIYKHNKAILRKTATLCALCGMPLDKSLKYPHPMSISIDHILPVTYGGKSTLDNLQATHLVCNKQKGKRIFALSNTENQNKQNSTNESIKRPYEHQKSLPQYIDWTNYEG